MSIRKTFVVAVGIAVLAGCATSPSPSSVVVYPGKGQAAPQQQRDSDECAVWAKRQSGYDPAIETAKGAGVGAVVGAVAGAATGAAVGAASGSGAGRGAATGAIVGGVGSAAVGGGYKYVKSREGYDKAYGACMEGRGYTVR